MGKGRLWLGTEMMSYRVGKAVQAGREEIVQQRWIVSNDKTQTL